MALEKSQTFIILRLINSGPGTEWHDNWSVTNSMLFTLTTLTLIGYGHICPK